jgi:oligosaccharide reducing-end xylanase
MERLMSRRRRHPGTRPAFLVVLLSGVAAAAGIVLASAASPSLPARAEQVSGTASVSARAPSPDGAGAFASRKYRNLFAEAGHTTAEIDAKIARAYNQLFDGNDETERLYFPSGENENGPLAYIPDIQHTDVRSEGMSYGMMIAVQLDKKREFDALWNWSMTYMYQKDPKHPTFGFFSWQMKYDGTVMDELPAPDGEEYYAMALYFAANRWGNGKGIYDYKAQADRLLRAMVHRAPITGPVRQRGGVREHTVGKEVNDEHAMILFSPDERNGFTDASYHLPAFYELWARWGPEEDRAFWSKAAQASRDFFVKAADAKTGLTPNMSQFDGTPLGSTRFPASFREDAWRVAMNWAVDWSWWAKDPRQRELCDRLQAFFEGQGMETYGDNWNLDGKVIRDRHSPGLVATNGVASLAATDAARAKTFTEALWKLDVPSSKIFRYYDGLLYMMSLLHASGRFQVIAPTAGGPAAPADRPGWRLAWHDEFDKAIGPDWVFDVGTGRSGWGNNEHQFYTSRPQNVRVEDGALVVEARRERYESSAFTSARLKTEGRKAFRYGRLEARIKIPRGPAVWPAFWALGEDIRTTGWPKGGEIDVMENIGREPSTVHATVHGPGYSGGKGVGAPFDLRAAFADDYHVFAVDWDPGRLVFSVDGREYQTVTPASVQGDWVFDRPFFLLLNLAIGGNWPGPPTDETPSSARMLVDYVRVYERAR